VEQTVEILIKQYTCGANSRNVEQTIHLWSKQYCTARC
jgi:hypothetical protein